MNSNEIVWDELVAKIRGWDRREHDWAVADKSIQHENIITKDKFIKLLMKEYELNRKTHKKSGFFDLPKQKTCNDPQHEAPKHICIPPGKGYRHVCPACGRVQEIIPSQTTL